MNLINYVWVFVFVTEIGAEKEGKLLSRKRRFLAFPDGSSFAASVLTTVGVIRDTKLQYVTFGISWGVAYALPNETWVLQHKHGFGNSQSSYETQLKSRYRRDLYEKFEIAMNSMGFNGRECMERTLCESSNYLKPGTGNMVEEIIKTLFSFPWNGLKSRVDREANHYDDAYGRGRAGEDCQRRYSKCHFSLFELVMGKLSAEPIRRAFSGFM